MVEILKTIHSDDLRGMSLHPCIDLKMHGLQKTFTRYLLSSSIMLGGVAKKRLQIIASSGRCALNIVTLSA